MNSPSTIRLGVSMTRGMSLEQWDRLGMLKREIAIYQKLAASIDSVTIFTYGNNDRKYTSLFPDNLIVVPKPWYIPSLIYSFLAPIVRRKIFKNLTLLKTNQMDGGWMMVIAKHLYGQKLIVRCGYEWLQFIEKSKRALLKQWIGRIVERFTYNNADTIIQTAIDSKNFVISRFGIDQKLITLIPNFADTETFAPHVTDRIISRIVCVGRLEPQKNLHALLEASKGMDITLVIIGDGSQRQELMALAEKLNISVEWKGKLQQVQIAKEFSQSSIYLLPSLYEGHPKTLLEAMSAGMACIGSSVPGISDTIDDGIDGILCGTDPVSIREALNRLLVDSDLRMRLGRAAREKVLQKYSLDAVVRQELSLYYSLLS